MKKSLVFNFIFVGVSPLVFASDFKPQSALSNHGVGLNGDSGLPLFDSQGSDSYSVDPELQRFTAALSLRASIKPGPVYPAGKDGFLDEKVAADMHTTWIRSLPEQALQEKCALLEEERRAKGYIGVVGKELLEEFYRRHPEGSSAVFAGLKRRENFSPYVCDTFCEEKKIKDVDGKIRHLVARNEEIERELLLSLPEPDNFRLLVIRQAGIARMLDILKRKQVYDQERGLASKSLPVLDPHGCRRITEYYEPGPRKKVRASEELK